MLHHIKFAIRVFLKDRFFSTLNILGLALGIAVSIVLLLILKNDLTYDRHHEHYARIYRLGAHEVGTGVDFWTSRAARELGPVLQEELPEVLGVVRANPWSRTLIKYIDEGVEKSWYEEDVVRTDSNFFHLFTHKFTAGDMQTSLKDPYTVVLSESVARKYFGDEDPLNKEIMVETEPYKVTGVIEDLPENSHLKFDLLLSNLIDRRGWTIEDGMVKSEAFWNPDVFTYILFPASYDPQTFIDKFPAIYDKYFKSFGDKVGGQYTPILERLDRIHFHSTLDGDEPHGNLAYLYAFTAIGLFIIILASINYMNLCTARAVNRAGEIAMRKAMGAGKARLVGSFLSESVVLSLAAMLLALAMVYLLLNVTPFNDLIEKSLKLDLLNNPMLVTGIVVVTLMIGVLSGLYPAFYLPAIPTIKALKGAYKNQKGSLFLRRTLTAFQFAISIFVVVCTFFMRQQIDYVRSKDLGFDKENVVMLSIQDTVVENSVDAIRNELIQNPKITSVTTSYNIPGFNTDGAGVLWAEGDNGMKQQEFALMFVGDDYLKTMGMTLLAGRDFQPGRADADRAFIANEAAMKLMGWNIDNAVGKKMRFFHDTDETKQVIGVVKDFNWNSLHNKIEPLVIVRAGGEGGFVQIRVNGDLPETLEYIRNVWTKYDTTHPYEYLFLDQEFNKQYKADEVQHKLLSWLSYICIFVSLLGLLGLSAFNAAQRTKEIGIRKVHGAAVPHIIYLLYRDVMYLVLIAAVLVVPVALYAVNDWMGNFAYKTEVNYLLFGLVTILALAASFLTVAFHSLRAARANPIESLKYE
jgi:putative ABC transport system permease protein